MANTAVADAVDYSDSRISSNTSIRSTDTIASLNGTTISATAKGITDVDSKSISSSSSGPRGNPRKKQANIEATPTPTFTQDRAQSVTSLDIGEKELELEDNSIVNSTNTSIVNPTNNSIAHLTENNADLDSIVGSQTRSRLNSGASIFSSVDGDDGNTNDFASANSFIRSSRINDDGSILSRSSSIASRGSLPSRKLNNRLSWSKEMMKASIHSFVLGTQWACGLFSNTDLSFKEELFEARHGLPDDFRKNIDIDALFNSIAFGYDGGTDKRLDHLAQILMKSAFYTDSKGLLHLDKVASKLLNFVEAREVKEEDARAAFRLGRIGAGYALNNMITDHTNDISERKNNIASLKMRLQETQNLLESNQKLLKGKGESVDIVKGLLDEQLPFKREERMIALLGEDTSDLLEVTAIDDSADTLSESKTALSKKEKQARVAALLYEQQNMAHDSDRADRATRERVGKARIQLDFLNEMENHLDNGFKVSMKDFDNSAEKSAQSKNEDAVFTNEAKISPSPSQPKLGNSREKPIPKRGETDAHSIVSQTQCGALTPLETSKQDNSIISNENKGLKSVQDVSYNDSNMATNTPTRAIPPRKRRPSIRTGARTKLHSTSHMTGKASSNANTIAEEEEHDWSMLEESGLELNISARLPDGSPLPSQSTAAFSTSTSESTEALAEAQLRAQRWRKRLNSLALGECHSAYTVALTDAGLGAHISTTSMTDSHSPLLTNPSNSHTLDVVLDSEYVTDLSPLRHTGGMPSSSSVPPSTSTSASSAFPSIDRSPWNSQLKVCSSTISTNNILFSNSISTAIGTGSNPTGAGSTSDITPNGTPKKGGSSQLNSVSRCERYHAPFLEAKICNKANIDLWRSRRTISSFKAVLWAVFQHFGDEQEDDVINPRPSLLAKYIRMKVVKKIFKEAQLTTVSPGGSSPSFVLRTASRLSTTLIDHEAKKIFSLTSASSYLTFSQFEKLIEQIAPMTLPADVAVPATRQQTRTRFTQGGGKEVYVQRSHAHLVGSPINKGGLDYTYGHKFGGSQNSRTRVSKNLMSKNKNLLTNHQSALNNVEVKLRELLKGSKVDCVYQAMFNDALEGTGLSLGDNDVLTFSAVDNGRNSNNKNNIKNDDNNNRNDNNNDNQNDAPMIRKSDSNSDRRKTASLWSKCHSSLEVLFNHFASIESSRFDSITPPADSSVLFQAEKEQKKVKTEDDSEENIDENDDHNYDSDSVAAYEVVAKEIVLDVISNAMRKTGQKEKEEEEIEEEIEENVGDRETQKETQKEKEKEKELESKEEVSPPPQGLLLSLRGLRGLLIECGLYDEFLLNSTALVGLVGTGNGLLDDGMLQDHFRQVKVWEWTIAHAVTGVATINKEGEVHDQTNVDNFDQDEVMLDTTTQQMCGLPMVYWNDLRLAAGNLGICLAGLIEFFERLAIDLYDDMPPTIAVKALIQKLEL